MIARPTPSRASACAISAAWRPGEASDLPPGRSLKPWPGRSIRMTAKPVDIAIVGGGIGGLALALALHQRSIPCRVYHGSRHMTRRP